MRKVNNLVTKCKSLLIEDNDIKNLGWKMAADDYHLGKLDYHKYSPIFSPFVIANRLFSTKNKLDGYCFRYLNDYPSLSKTLLRALAEAISILILKMFRKRVLWICHNVDAETESNYQVITKFRRGLLKRFSDRIFVTDKLLVPHAQSLLRRKEIYVCSFGDTTKIISETGVDLPDKAKQWIFTLRKTNSTMKIGLWIGSANKKNLDSLRLLVNLAKDQNKRFAFVVIGPISKVLSKIEPDIYKEIKDNPYIYKHFDYFPLEISVWNCYFDFVVKGLSDLSIGFTIYQAVSVKLPILTLSNSFIERVVEEYNIGVAVDIDNYNPYEVFKVLERKDWAFENFSKVHSWYGGARSLFDGLVD